MGGAQTAGEKLREACVSLRPGGALVRAALVAALWVVASAGQARPTQGRHCIDRRVEHVLFLSRANRHCPKALRMSPKDLLRGHTGLRRRSFGMNAAGSFSAPSVLVGWPSG